MIIQEETKALVRKGIIFRTLLYIHTWKSLRFEQDMILSHQIEELE